MRKIICAILFAGMAHAILAAPATPMRLPDTAAPLAYHLDLSVDPEKPTHSGTVRIDIEIKRPTTVLRLNATDITIRSARLSIGGRRLAARTNKADDDMIDLVFPAPLPAGRGELDIAFRGKINDKDVEGLFRQKEGHDWYAFTQFESTSARQAFPSFDEPRWKVPWSISLTVPQKLTAVANTPVRREVRLPGGLKRVEFQTTRPLPSYLVAFGVGPFSILDGGMAGKAPLRIITPRGRAHEARYAAKMTPAIVSRLENYFGMDYPYEKLDLMVLPITVGFGAMENPGLITFESGLLIAKPDNETDNFKRGFVSVAAHELAHQWFGDYVTMVWWDDLWLNESFASWMGDKITDQVMPEWHWDTSLERARARAMKTDRLASARRIHQPVDTPEDLSGAFDDITYQKGQAMLGMFETWLGAERFRNGVRRYMARHAWGNATGRDFIAALSDGDTALAEAFASFTEQPGIPKLHVRLDCSATPRAVLAQSRFLPLGSAAQTGDAHWSVPVTIRTPGGVTRYLLKDKTGSVTLPDAACPAWIQANADGSGYYRPVYEAGRLTALMQRDDLSVNEILAGLNDALALTETGDVPMADALDLAVRYAAHPRQEVAIRAGDILLKAGKAVAPDKKAAYTALWQRAYGQRLRTLGLTPKPADSNDDHRIREVLAFNVADKGDDAGLRREAETLVHRWLRKPDAIAPSMRETVFAIAALNGDPALFDAMAGKLRRTGDRLERSQLLNALARFRPASLAERARGLMLDPALDPRESIYVLRIQNEEDTLRDGSLAFVKRHFDDLVNRLPKDSPGGFPRSFNGYCSEESADAVDRQFRPGIEHFDGGPTHLAQSLETIRLCAAWRGAQQGSLNRWLTRDAPAAP
ncbi:M1 family metallopeptidase [Paludibacterium paludis]|uniref:Aminopeptidase n=1 Tax=Paludibacterium paludis TaxID=1225769 RepID=A0A918P3Y4_9NEIS|nr:M1 family metallopeptidase [Paludibacterium paludis]GGY18260.1 aminopeptidase N [Paludibacterium paludis]